MGEININIYTFKSSILNQNLLLIIKYFFLYFLNIIKPFINIFMIYLLFINIISFKLLKN